MAADKPADQRFKDWVGRRDPREYALRTLAIEYESRYFKDLCLKQPAIKRRIFLTRVITADGREEEFDGVKPEISIDTWIFKYRRFRERWFGLCDCKQRTVFIRPGLSDSDHRATVLHEMIHAYEFQLPQVLKEWSVVELYRRISKSVRPSLLHRFMDASTHAETVEGSHGVLFLLKSLQLDREFGWPWGTVFNYGRSELFAPFKKASAAMPAK